VLCLHGFTGTPFEIQPIADALAAEGYLVAAPMLAGHGVDPITLEATRWPDWLESAEGAFEMLARRVSGRIAIVGFSMGGLLALRLARKHPERVAALAVLSAPLRLRRAQVGGIRLLGLIPRPLRIGALRAIPKSLGSDVARADLRGTVLGLPAMPLGALQSLLVLMAEVRSELKHIETPTLVVHGRQDHTVPIADSIALADGLGGPEVERLWLDGSYHLVGIDVDRQAVIDAIIRFLATRARW